MTRVAAKQSADGKYVVCGFCGTSLCRRDWRAGVRDPGYYLTWEDVWRLDPAAGYIERVVREDERLEAGRKPQRRDWANRERIELSVALARYEPAMCDCGTLNEIKPRRLRVKGVAPFADRL
jgi:hypothetical protein